MTHEYKILFNAITDAIELLKSAQQMAEEIYISREENPVIDMKVLSKIRRQ